MLMKGSSFCIRCDDMDINIENREMIILCISNNIWLIFYSGFLMKFTNCCPKNIGRVIAMPTKLKPLLEFFMEYEKYFCFFSIYYKHRGSYMAIFPVKIMKDTFRGKKKVSYLYRNFLLIWKSIFIFFECYKEKRFRHRTYSWILE